MPDIVQECGDDVRLRRPILSCKRRRLQGMLQLRDLLIVVRRPGEPQPGEQVVDKSFRIARPARC
jgi:hypothetical protein